jgi:hypothetical protein
MPDGSFNAKAGNDRKSLLQPADNARTETLVNRHDFKSLEYENAKVASPRLISKAFFG